MTTFRNAILSEGRPATAVEGSAVAFQPTQSTAATGRGPIRLGILLSGRGSNFLAIAESIRTGRLKNVEIALVTSNVAEAGGIAKAREMGLPTQVLVSKGRRREEHDADVIVCLEAHRVDLVCLAGYMRLFSPAFVAAFPNRILNIHPSLLPAFPGLDAQTQAFEYGAKVTGCTVHFVDNELDHGAIILQRAIPVLDGDDAHSLAARILIEEHIAYAEAIARVVSGEYEIRGRRYVKAGTEGTREQAVVSFAADRS
ncbi:MAG: phosphoribosylglycinamide formyltransferase [Terracidiphilus sp.]